MIVSFTGHRPKKIKSQAAISWITLRLKEKLLELQPDETISGMALGFDQLAANVCLELGIPFIAAIPFPGQELDWKWEQQQPYYTLLAKAARVHMVSQDSPTGHWDAVEKLMARNRWMVDNSNAVIAAWDGSSGGTEKCVKYARKEGRTIHRIQGWPV